MPTKKRVKQEILKPRESSPAVIDSAPAVVSRMGKPSSFTPAIQEKIIGYLEQGCLIKDICGAIGIGVSTFFDWVKAKPDFAQEVTRAKSEAFLNATIAIKVAFSPHPVKTSTTITTTETRLKKDRDENGNLVQTPYEYKKTEVKESVTMESDWRAAIEYLQRRDPDRWANRLILRVDSDQQEILSRFGITANDAFATMILNLAAALGLDYQGTLHGESLGALQAATGVEFID